jgi:hypothetical protein
LLWFSTQQLAIDGETEEKPYDISEKKLNEAKSNDKKKETKKEMDESNLFHFSRHARAMPAFPRFSSDFQIESEKSVSNFRKQYLTSLYFSKRGKGFHHTSTSIIPQ